LDKWWEESRSGRGTLNKRQIPRSRLAGTRTTKGLNSSVYFGSIPFYYPHAIFFCSEISSAALENVEHCRQELESAISEAKEASSPTHFISVPLEGIDVLVKEYTRLVEELMQDECLPVISASSCWLMCIELAS